MSNLKKYHVSKNLFDASKERKNTYITTADYIGTSAVTNLSDYTEINTTHLTLSGTRETALQNPSERAYCFYTENKTFIDGVSYDADISTPVTITVPNNAVYIRFAYDKSFEGAVMLNTGSTALPYEPYSADVWHDLAPKRYENGTFVDTTNNPEKYSGGSWS